MSKQQKKRATRNKMIKLNSMVTLNIRDQSWIGQVVEIRKSIALVRLLDNMHYHADLSELTLFIAKPPTKG
jgi:hypothetical protein